MASKFNDFSKYKTVESVKNVFQYIACVGGLDYMAVIHSMSVLCCVDACLHTTYKGI
jgi:hypothetical protein